MRIRRKLVVLFLATVMVVGAGLLLHQGTKPRRDALSSLSLLATELGKPGDSDVLRLVVIPISIRDRTPAEQKDFLIKALSDEISSQGVAALERHGTFDSLLKLFPDKAEYWCKHANVAPSDCVAFKMSRNGIEAEVVLVHEGGTYRVLRCDNVKQMAGAS